MSIKKSYNANQKNSMFPGNNDLFVLYPSKYNTVAKNFQAIKFPKSHKISLSSPPLPSLFLPD